MLTAEATPLPIPPVATPATPVYQVVVATDSLDMWALIVNIVVALATIAAVVVAARIGVREIKHLRQEQRDREATQERRKALDIRAQAETIGAWETYWLARRDGSGALENNDEAKWLIGENAVRRHRALYVSNASDSPIYEVRVRYTSENPTVSHYIDFYALPPMHTTAGRDIGADVAFDHISVSFATQVEFRDSAGRHWRRDTDGILVHLDYVDEISPDARAVYWADQLDQDIFYDPSQSYVGP